MNLEALIPKDKFDIETAHQLNQYSYQELKPIIPDLLEWLQDCNWPVSKPVAEYLLTVSEHLTDDIVRILRGNDDIWKYYILTVFFQDTDKTIDIKVIAELERMLENPTQGEEEEGVLVVAEEIMNTYKN